MKLPDSRGDSAPTRHFMPQSETSSAWNKLQHVGALTKGFHKNHQTSQVISKAIGCFHQPDRKVLFLNIPVSSNKEIELVLN